MTKITDELNEIEQRQSGSIFAEDEMYLASIHPEWSDEELLSQQAVFYLKDVANRLHIGSQELKKAANQLQAAGKNPWEEIGIRKTWTHWIVRMKPFSAYYRTLNPLHINKVSPTWDANELLTKQGLFFLAEVCQRIPFTAQQIRYQVRGYEDSKTRFGVWKDPNHKSYLVDMEVFSTWIKSLWRA